MKYSSTKVCPVCDQEVEVHPSENAHKHSFRCWEKFVGRDPLESSGEVRIGSGSA